MSNQSNTCKAGHLNIQSDCAHCQTLLKTWYKKAAKSGFVDQEDENGNLKQHDTRTIAFENRDKIRDFFLKLDHWLLTAKIPKHHRQILELYSAGTHIKGEGGIMEQVKMSDKGVRLVIEKYQTIVLRAI